MRLALNGEWQEPLRYVRNVSDPYTEAYDYPGVGAVRYYTYPHFFIDNPESVRCGRDNMAHAPDTDVLTVQAGDTLEWAHQSYPPREWTDEQFNDCPEGRGTCHPKGQILLHPGPIIVHISKVPDGQDVRDYDGSGEWVKIYSIGLEYTEGAKPPLKWLPQNLQQLPPRFIFDIPSQTPEGQYLIRIDQSYAALSIHTDPRYIYGQMYPSCAQIEVKNSAPGELPTGVGIPEAFAPDLPGMRWSTNMTGRACIDPTYEYPGGPIWDGTNVTPDSPTFARC
jgi:hypothetical protein